MSESERREDVLPELRQGEETLMLQASLTPSRVEFVATFLMKYRYIKIYARARDCFGLLGERVVKICIRALRREPSQAH